MDSNSHISAQNNQFNAPQHQSQFVAQPIYAQPTVVQQGAQPFMMNLPWTWAPYPMGYVCHQCRSSITTKTKGTFKAMFCLYTGLAIFFNPQVEHRCPNCKVILGNYKTWICCPSCC